MIRKVALRVRLRQVVQVVHKPLPHQWLLRRQRHQPLIGRRDGGLAHLSSSGWPSC
ncbi:hypothetical protein ACQPYE_15240 [Actinosynnema sp. CA-299493]